jgi:peroxiredoxin
MRLILHFATVLASLAAVLTASVACAQVTDLDGKLVRHLAAPGERIVVLIFAATDCPICNQFVPVINQLQDRFAERGVVFWWVFTNPEDTLAVVRQHREKFRLHGRILVDAKQELVARAHVTVTPEAAVFVVENANLREVYHGRIDDRYVSFGVERPQAGHQDLKEAIEATLAGKLAPKPAAGPVGCSIVPVSMKP